MRNTEKGEPQQQGYKYNFSYLKPLDRALAFFKIILVITGCFLVYLGFAYAVYNYPEVMIFLGLESFVHYLMQEQATLYEEAIQLKGPEFAVSFFHFRAASLLMSGILLIVGIRCAAVFSTTAPSIFEAFVSDDFEKVIGDNEAFEKNSKAFLKDFKTFSKADL